MGHLTTTIFDISPRAQPPLDEARRVPLGRYSGFTRALLSSAGQGFGSFWQASQEVPNNLSGRP